MWLAIPNKISFLFTPLMSFPNNLFQVTHSNNNNDLFRLTTTNNSNNNNNLFQLTGPSSTYIK